MATVDIQQLTSVYEKRQAYFNTLPYGVLAEALAQLDINLLQVDNKDVLYTFLRKQGLMKPYSGANSDLVEYSDLGKIEERELNMKAAFAAIKDHVKSLKEKNPLNRDFKGVNQSKKSPYLDVYLENKIKTFGEDVLDALFFAERNTADLSPMGCFDGFNSLLDTEVAAGGIATGKGNLRDSGSLAAPANDDDTTAFDNFVAWLRAGSTFLQGKPSVIYIPKSTLANIKDAGFNKFRTKAADINVIEKAFDKADVQQAKIISHYCLGTGNRIMWTVPRNLDFGMNNEGDMNFVQVTTPFKDPNFFQLWMQAEFGCRIRATHSKVFMMNTGTNTSVPLSGDYVS